jgi:hypothetical protein
MKQRALKQQKYRDHTLEEQVQLSRVEVRAWPRWILEASGLIDELAESQRLPATRARRVRQT